MEGGGTKPERGPEIPARNVSELAKIVHDTRVALAGDDRFKEAFKSPVLKKHLEPRQENRIRTSIMSYSVELMRKEMERAGKRVYRFKKAEAGKPFTANSPYAYGKDEQERIVTLSIERLANPASARDTHPEGFKEAWLAAALEEMRKS